MAANSTFMNTGVREGAVIRLICVEVVFGTMFPAHQLKIKVCYDKGIAQERL